MPSHIPHNQPKIAVSHGHKIVIVAARLLRTLSEPGQLQTIQLWGFLRKQSLLNLARDAHLLIGRVQGRFGLTVAGAIASLAHFAFHRRH